MTQFGDKIPWLELNYNYGDCVHGSKDTDGKGIWMNSLVYLNDYSNSQRFEWKILNVLDDQLQFIILGVDSHKTFLDSGYEL